jgi:hypothetical protein
LEELSLLLTVAGEPFVIVNGDAGEPFVIVNGEPFVADTGEPLLLVAGD